MDLKARMQEMVDLRKEQLIKEHDEYEEKMCVLRRRLEELAENREDKKKGKTN